MQVNPTPALSVEITYEIRVYSLTEFTSKTTEKVRALMHTSPSDNDILYRTNLLSALLRLDSG